MQTKQQRPRRMLAHERFGVVQRTGQDVDITRITDVAEHPWTTRKCNARMVFEG